MSSIVITNYPQPRVNGCVAKMPTQTFPTRTPSTSLVDSATRRTLPPHPTQPSSDPKRTEQNIAVPLQHIDLFCCSGRCRCAATFAAVVPPHLQLSPRHRAYHRYAAALAVVVPPCPQFVPPAARDPGRRWLPRAPSLPAEDCGVRPKPGASARPSRSAPSPRRGCGPFAAYLGLPGCDQRRQRPPMANITADDFGSCRHGFSCPAQPPRPRFAALPRPTRRLPPWRRPVSPSVANTFASTTHAAEVLANHDLQPGWGKAASSTAAETVAQCHGSASPCRPGPPRQMLASRPSLCSLINGRHPPSQHLRGAHIRERYAISKGHGLFFDAQYTAGPLLDLSTLARVAFSALDRRKCDMTPPQG